MKTEIISAFVAAATLAAAHATPQATTSSPAGTQAGNTTPTLFGQVPGPYGYFRCGTAPVDPLVARNLPPSDCSSNNTTPDAMYSPANLEVLQIQVAFHVISRTNGQGDVPDSRVNSQIDILNEDFRALTGTPGSNGTDTKIEFVLATTDPQGNPTNGIIRHSNNTWYNDGGSYWNSIAWDPDTYMNVYSLGAPSGSSQILGYVPFLPASSPNSVGNNSDRVVVLNDAVGRNAPAAPYNQGRTLTHEVGHYLGLNHTFNNGCGGSNCYRSGDLICDTNSESQPEYNCPNNSSSCGSTDPVRNYMNYSPDTCMRRFTEEQSRRMRCTLMFYRPDLGVVSDPVLGSNYCVLTPNSTGGSARLLASGTKSLSANDFGLLATSMPPNVFGFFVVSNTQAQVANPGGSQGTLCLGGTVGRYLSQVGNSGPFGEFFLTVDVNAVPQPTGLITIQPGETWNFQAWFRDSNPNVTSNFTDGYTITFE